MAKVTLTNQADFTGTYGAAENPVTFSSNQVSTTIIQGLTATKTADKEFWIDGPLLYTIQIQNSSGDTFSKGVLKDTLDSIVTLDTAFGVKINDSATSDFTFNGGVLSVNLPDMADGGTLTVTFQVIQTTP